MGIDCQRMELCLCVSWSLRVWCIYRDRFIFVYGCYEGIPIHSSSSSSSLVSLTTHSLVTSHLPPHAALLTYLTNFKTPVSLKTSVNTFHAASVLTNTPSSPSLA